MQELINSIDESKTALTAALSDLDIKVTENKSLGEHISELVGAVSTSKATLTDALKTLDVKIDENR